MENQAILLLKTADFCWFLLIFADFCWFLCAVPHAGVDYDERRDMSRQLRKLQVRHYLYIYIYIYINHEDSPIENEDYLTENNNKITE